MKIVTITAAAAALLAGLTLASAQNAPTTKVNPSPNSINKGLLDPTPSGAESRKAATGIPAKVVGKGKFCVESPAGSLNCKFASMDACQKKSTNLNCVARPAPSTVGKKP